MDNKLISHVLDKPLKLNDHIEQVINASLYLISKKSLYFNGIARSEIEAVTMIIAACHDFGKATSYFQEYIKSMMDSQPQYTGSEKDKSHSLVSGLFGWYVAEKWIQGCRMDKRWKLFLPLAVFLAIEGHHGFYNSIENALKKIDESVESGLLQRQLMSVQKEIYSYEFESISLQIGADFCLESVKKIKKQLRRIHREYHRESLDNLVEQRIFGLLLFSILLEADKAYLASDNSEQYERDSILIPDDIVDRYVKKALPKGKAIDKERERAYTETLQGIKQLPLNERIHSITLPTGLGKTLLAASWAIKLRSKLQKTGSAPKIVVSLPFLSIIEQTDDEYKKVFSELYEERADRLYSTHYSIADFEYKDGLDKEERSDNCVDFFLSIWNSEVVVTTFDQLLYSLFSLKAKHLMRFHNLFNAILVFDEIQALPSALWKPFEFFFRKLAEVGDTHVLLMSATQPGYFPGAIERVPDHQSYFSSRKRTEVSLNPNKITIDEFIDNLSHKLNGLKKQSVMIVLNTRASSKKVYEAVREAMSEGNIGKRPLVYLSSYVAPAQRIKRVKRINKYISRRANPLIISTQCIEAGVDLDVDYIIRDWAPLDSIFQVCGRCNRNGEKGIGTIEIVHLISENNSSYSHQVYDEILLECTVFSLNNTTNLYEDQFYNYGRSYFQYVREGLGRSMKIVEAFANYTHKYEVNGGDANVEIKKLLRGDDWQEQFIISSLDPTLTQDIKCALEIEDRWERRYTLKRLGKRIAENSVNVRFEKWMPSRPDDFANYKIGNFRIIDEQFYDKCGAGFSADVHEQNTALKII